MKTFLAVSLCALYALCATSIKLDCDNPDNINSEHIHYCCKHPDGHNDIIDACAKETGFKLPNPNEEAIVDITAESAIAGTCFGKCVFNKFKFMKNPETLDMDAVKKYYSATYKSDAEYVKEMINAFDHCHGNAEKNTASFLSKPLFQRMSDKFCEPMASVVWACVVREFFHNCPTDRWSKTAECTTVKEFSQKCNESLATI